MIRNYNIFKGIVLSMAIHLIVFMQYQVDFSFSESSAPAENQTNQIAVQLVKYVEPVKQVIKKVVTENKVIKSIAKKSLLPTEIAITKEIKKPLEKIQEDELIQPEQLIKVAEKNIEDIASETTNNQPVLQLQHENELEKERKDYIQRLLAHIETYKFYPRSARQRAIEGKLDVTFYLRDNGSHKSLTIDGGRAVLQRAVRQALNDAQPFPKPPTSFVNNQPIVFSMYYKLDNS